MKIGRIIRNIQAKAERRAVIRKENNIKKYFNISDFDVYGDSYSQMYTARHGIANYAKQNGVSVDVYDANKFFDEDFNLPKRIKERLRDKLELVVTNRKSGKSRKAMISANTKKSFPKMAVRKFLLPVPGEELEVARGVYSTTDDNLLRNLYRAIERLTKEAKAKK